MNQEPALFERLEPRRTPTIAFGPEFLINVTTSGAQAVDSVGAIATDASGNFVITWESFNQDSLLSWGVYGRRYNAGGTAQGSEFLVNATLLDDQRAPAVAMNASGAFAIAWEGRGLLGALFPGVYVQRYNASGVAQGTEIGVAGSLLLSITNVSIAMDSSGGFVVAWEDASITGRDISARRYAADGTALGAAFTVNQTTSGNQLTPRIAMDSAGNFLIVWTGNGSGDNSGVFARLYNAAGTAQTGEVLVNVTTSGTQELASIAPDPSGGYIVAWSGQGAGDSSGVLARRITSAGAISGTEVLINETTSGVQQSPAIAIDPDGDYLISWSGEGIGDSDGVFAREFFSSDTAKAGEFAIPSTLSGTQASPSLATRGDNAYALAWSGNGTGDVEGVFARLFKNSPPTVTTTGSTLAYTENAGAIAIDPGLLLSDSDSAALTGATVSISANYASAEDTLAFTDQLGIMGSWNPGTGILTLSGTATLANYQAALRAITYANSSNNPSAATRTISFTITDGADPSTASTRNISIAPVNDPPAITTTGTPLSYTENAGALAIDASLLISDVDSTSIVGAVITISVGFAAGEDLLAFVDQLGISGSWNASAGILTLTGTTTIANYQAALRAITYANSSSNPSTIARTISFIVNDGSDPSIPATRGITITPVNDPPVVTTTSGTLSYTENAGPIAIDPALLISDVDSPTLTSATITISANHASAEDILAFTNQLGITGSWNASLGILTLTGIATVSDYQTALRTITYANSSNNPSTLTRTVSFVVTDGTDPSTSATRNISVTPVNDPPSITTNPSPLSYTENAGPVPVDPTLALSDPDSTTIATATITISSGYAPAEDALAFTNQLGIFGSWNAGLGVLTLSGLATIADYQAALRSISYANSSNNPSAAPRAISFIVHDGTDPSAPATRTITITPVNDRPSITTTPTTLSYTENQGPLAIDSGLLLSDPDSTTLVGATIAISAGFVMTQDILSFTNQVGISGVWNPDLGILTLSGTATIADYQAALRSIAYTNASENPSTSRTISFVVDDGSGPSTPATRAIVILPINDAPVITTTPTPLSYIEDAGAILLDPALLLSDPDSTSLSGAVITITGNYIIGEDFLAFTNQLGITGLWDPGPGRLTLTGIATLANYQSALRAITYANTSQSPSTATRTVTFSITDGQDPSSPATRAVAITPVNDAPVLTTTPSVLNYSENDPATPIDPGLTLSDPDTATLLGAVISIAANYTIGQDLLTFIPQLGITGVWNPTSGTLTLSGISTLASYQAALRSITYHNTSENPSTAPRTISFIVDDGPSQSNPATRSISISPVNDAPTVTATSSPLTYAEGSPFTPVDPALLISDPDSLFITGATIAFANGYVSAEDRLNFIDQLGITGSWDTQSGVLTLTGAATVADYQAALRSIAYLNLSANPSLSQRLITFTITDGLGFSDDASRALLITSVDNPPTVTTSTGTPLFTEGGLPVLIDPAIFISDPDSATLIGAIITISNFAPNQDSLTFIDQLGITGSWNAGTGMLVLTGAASVADYQLALRSITYANSSSNPVPGNRTITFEVSDATGTSPPATKTLSVAAVDTEPTITTASSPLAYLENAAPLAIDPALIVQDPDSNIFSAVITITGNYVRGEDFLTLQAQSGITAAWDAVAGTLTLSGSASPAAYQAALRTVAYFNTSDNPATSTRTIALTVVDAVSSSAPASRDITITAVNDLPAAHPDTIVQPGNPQLLISPSLLLSNDLDAEGNSLSVVLQTPPLFGTLLLLPSGDFLYIAGPDFPGADAFTYAARDAGGTGTPAQVLIIIDLPPIPPPPPSPPPTTAPPTTLAPPELDDPPVSLTPTEPIDADPRVRVRDPVGRAPAPPSSTPPESAPPEAAPPTSPAPEDQRIAEADPPPPSPENSQAPPIELAADPASQPVDPSLVPPPPTAQPLQVPIFTIRAEESNAAVIAASRRADERVQVIRTVAGGAAVTTTAFSVGYVVWTFQKGVLVASYMSGLSVAHSIDPLPVVEYWEARDATGRTSRRSWFRNRRVE
jgi:hypothetical protein